MGETHDYLILARCSMDDIPLQLLKDVTIGEARDAAAGWTDQAIIAVADAVFDIDASEIIGVSVVQFDAAGQPIEVAMLDEPEDSGFSDDNYL